LYNEEQIGILVDPQAIARIACDDNARLDALPGP
jgi:hypothetical protein